MTEDLEDTLVAEIRLCLDSEEKLFVFSSDNMDKDLVRECLLAALEGIGEASFDDSFRAGHTLQ